MRDGDGVLGWLRRLLSGMLGLGVNTVVESRILGAEIARRDESQQNDSEDPAP